MSMLRIVATTALLCLILSAAGFRATASASVSSQAEEAAAVARATLIRLPAEARLEEIKNEQLRRSVQAAYRVVVEIAENRDTGKVGVLNAKFERSYAAVERETTRSKFHNCLVNCRAVDGESCASKCKPKGQKFCGCKLIEFGCLVAECIF
jgi:hypothetical protein